MRLGSRGWMRVCDALLLGFFACLFWVWGTAPADAPTGVWEQHPLMYVGVGLVLLSILPLRLSVEARLREEQLLQSRSRLSPEVRPGVSGEREGEP